MRLNSLKWHKGGLGGTTFTGSKWGFGKNVKTPFFGEGINHYKKGGGIPLWPLFFSFSSCDNLLRSTLGKGLARERLGRSPPKIRGALTPLQGEKSKGKTPLFARKRSIGEDSSLRVW